MNTGTNRCAWQASLPVVLEMIGPHVQKGITTDSSTPSVMIMLGHAIPARQLQWLQRSAIMNRRLPRHPKR